MVKKASVILHIVNHTHAEERAQMTWLVDSTQHPGLGCGEGVGLWICNGAGIVRKEVNHGW